ncbi:hypothetical protein DCAR_0206110 [Daucus carota subsp. sativus]|uniref:Uncharacterized protein n=1 Tax=Daucus carota subsp. sativus TaxID=79200 RepID=A0AAF0WDN8_DAUCS|nr:hypothetical protein DCAR_0206110 [Daucus carota subsp. sativus]
MGVRVPRIINLKQILSWSSFLINPDLTSTIPRGCLAVYIGERQRSRFVVPVSYLNEPAFQELLSQAEEELGFNHPEGGLTIPCSVDTFNEITSCLTKL